MRWSALTVAAVLAACWPAAAAELTVEVVGARDDKGRVLVRLFDSPDGFPSGAGAARGEAAAEIVAGRARVTFAVPPGDYALVAIHDENGDGAMEKTLLGLPEEGYAVSNDPRPLTVPRFDSGRFTMGSQPVTLRMTLVYY